MITYQIDSETGNVKALIKTPPYLSFLQSAVMRPDGSGYDLSMLTEQQMAEAVANANGVPMKCPLWMRLEGEEWWLLPYEPIVSVNGKNVIVKKQVSKGKVRGSIKERWSQDDYQISISGILINPSGTGFPDEDVKRLRRLCEAGKVQVMSPLMEVFSIDQIVIEGYDFPFTSGPNNQAYTISASSDDIYKLLLRSEDLKIQ
ncbi:MAG: hypothetical protein IJ307_05860 [Bacteroidales bacterium]|nr:hypothetical protein [Bacteroidales bacterium]